MKLLVVALLAALVAVSHAKSASTTGSDLKCFVEWNYNFIQSECADLELSACVAKAKKNYTTSTCKTSSSVSSSRLGKTSSHALVGIADDFVWCMYEDLLNLASGNYSDMENCFA